jgi:NAD(P)H dehydrogenase (quinone)
MMSTETVLVIGATGRTGHYTVQHLLERGHAVRAMVHKEDEEGWRLTGAAPDT